MHEGFINLCNWFSNSILDNSTVQMAETDNTESVVQVMMVCVMLAKYLGNILVSLHFYYRVLQVQLIIY